MEYPAVENRFEQARQAEGAGQFSPYAPDARGAAAVVAVYNVRNLVLQNITTEWPAKPDVDMNLVWARNVDGGLIDCPLGTPSTADTDKYDMERCGVIVRDESTVGSSR
jgi:hypothetical protein